MFLNALDHAAHIFVEALLGALGVAGIAGAVLAWRLSQGPIDITGLAQRDLPALAGAGVRLSIGHAALAWEGFFTAGSPFDIRVDDIELHGPQGKALLTLPRGRVTLSVPQLLRGRVVPRTIEIDDARLALERTAGGRVLLDFGRGAGGGGNAVVAELARPTRPETAPSGPLPWLSQLRAVRIRRASVTVHDAVLGLVWQAQSGDADLRRRPDGGVTGSAEFDLAVAGLRARLTATAELNEGGTRVTASTTDFNPAALARAAPAFSALAMADLPVHFGVSAELSRDLAPRNTHLSVAAGAGRVLAGSGAVAIRSAAAELELASGQARLTALTVALAPPAKATAPPPVLIGTAAARQGPGGFAASFALRLDRVAFADLAAYWPLGTGGGARPWVVENITAGTAHDGTVSGTVTASPGFGNITLTSLSGGVAADGMTLWWLRPIPPITRASARLVIEGPDAIRVAVSKGAQGKLRIDQGSIRISGLLAKDQIGDIAATIAGPLPEALGLLANRRLNLLSRFPISFTNPAGQVSAKIAVRLPLDVRVTLDQIGISANTDLAGVHLGNIAAGRDLDDGTLALAVNTDQLTMRGTGTVAGIPARLGLLVDFRAGPPDQVLERLTASGNADAAALHRLGLPDGYVTGGSAGLTVDYASRRNRTATVQLGADLTRTVMDTPAGWSKPAGAAAQASALLQLQQGRVVEVQSVRADGPGMMLRGRAEIGAAANTLRIDRAMVGRSDLHGTIMLPKKAGPIVVALSGPALDVSAYLKGVSGQEPATAEKPGPPWEATLHFGTVIIGSDEHISPVSLTAASDGRRIVRARLDAQSGGVRASIAPAPGGRHLSIASADSGEVLVAAGVTDSIRGGSLRVEADYADAEPGAPLNGTATLDRFRITDAPAAGRLLKAMTLYGALDLLRGPGLGFMRAILPFRWERRVLTLHSARAYSASLGLTAKGSIDLANHTADIAGTIVPAYFFNTLLGHLPVVGGLFSPEKGGGVFAARYTVRGRLADPKVGVNPLSVLTPGFLRGIFGPG